MAALDPSETFAERPVERVVTKYATAIGYNERILKQVRPRRPRGPLVAKPMASIPTVPLKQFLHVPLLGIKLLAYIRRCEAARRT